MISWFIDKKGINFLLDAMKSLEEEDFEEIQLILAGEGSLKGKYLQYVEENNLSNMVVYW